MDVGILVQWIIHFVLFEHVYILGLLSDCNNDAYNNNKEPTYSDCIEVMLHFIF